MMIIQSIDITGYSRYSTYDPMFDTKYIKDYLIQLT